MWPKGTHSNQIYSQTKTASAAAPGYEIIVVAGESQLTLSQDGSGDWSEATLTMQVTRCLADTYQCLITDTNTQQSQSDTNLYFEGE